MDNIETIVSMEELVPLIQEQLSMGYSVRIFPRGISMMPMLRQGIDSVILSPIPDKLKKYDLPLYQRDNGKYVLHRVIDVGHTYTCMGDNQFVAEQDLRHDQMIAVVTAFYRNEKKYSCCNWFYQLYCRLWNYSRPLRKFVRRAIGWIRRHLR